MNLSDEKFKMYKVWRKRNDDVSHPLYLMRTTFLDECEKRKGIRSYSFDELWCMTEILEHAEEVARDLNMDFNSAFSRLFVKMEDAWVGMDDEFAEALLNDAAVILTDALNNETYEFVATKEFAVLTLQTAKSNFYKELPGSQLFTKRIYSKM